MNIANDTDRLAELAARDLQEHRIAAAEAKCLRALSADRQHRGALNVLGMVLHAQGRHEDAVRVFHALTQFEPNDAGHWANLGTALRPTRRYDAALQAFDRAVELGGVTADLLYSVGTLHVDRSDYTSACEMFRRAVALAPADAGLRLAHAQCCFDAMRPEEALETLAGWQHFTGLTPEVVAGIAHLLVTMGGTRHAEPALRRALDDAQRGGPISLRLVRVLERTNRLAEARETLERVKARPETDRNDADLLLTEATLAQRVDKHADACRLFAAILQHHDDFLRRFHVLFPLAKSLDALARYAEAYATLEEAHRSQVAFITTALGRQETEESPAIELARLGCDPPDVATWQNSGAPGVGDSPIFIVAFPRSGTTLLEQILDAHPALMSMDETPYLKRALEDARGFGIRYPAELGRLSDQQLQRIREHYWREVRTRIELRPGQRLVDKNPLNMMRLPLIRRLFPHARVVLAVRHPCDTLLSCFQQQFRAPDLALICRNLPTLAHNFRTAFDFWYSQLPLLGAAGTLELRYETLVADFSAEVHRLADFLLLPWHDSLLAPGEHARAKGYISTPSYSQVVEPINSRSIDRWKHYQAHFTQALPTLMPYVERWGYTV
ncbi:MAG TPA: sulfotransferase [Steroidobacteraceae bacterium]|nr:sulfotransferase [Steroidobacteraceae bacterium]